MSDTSIRPTLAFGFQATFVGIGAAGIDGRQGLNTNGKVSGMNARPTTYIINIKFRNCHR